MRARMMAAAFATAMAATAVAGTPSAAQAQDRMFSSPMFPAEMHGRPRWVVAAHCVALFETHDAVMERSRAAHRASEAAKGNPLGPDTPDTLATFARMSAEAVADGRSMTEYGLLRLGRDRPGQNAAAMFAAEVARQRTAHEQLNRTAREYGQRKTSCEGFGLNIASDYGYLRAGRPDRRDTADGSL